MQIKTISSKQLEKNPFNVKNPLTPEELSLFRESLERWGISRLPIVCDFPGDEGHYAILDGNTLKEYLPKDEEIQVQYIEGIDSEDKLKQITLDFIGIYKKVNRTGEQRLAESIKEILSDTQKARYAIDLQIEKAVARAQEDSETSFSRMVVVEFREPEAYDEWKKLCGKVKDGIRMDSKLIQFIGELDDSLIEKSIGQFCAYIKRVMDDEC
jgi:hypothetical protein